MSFPPPFRFLLPLLLLVLGLTATWLDYELNLANDLQRHFNEAQSQAEATGTRLAALAQQHLASGEIAPIRESLATWKNEPWLRMIAVVDENGVIVAGSDSAWEVRSAGDTPVAIVWERARKGTSKVMEVATDSAGETLVLAAFPITSGLTRMKWLLVVYDRANAVTLARLDARLQMFWFASVIAFFCLCLWAVLHFGVAARLARLARSVRGFGEDATHEIETIGGGDEVHELSEAFTEMGRRLADRERERGELEREVIDSTENERRRIGRELHDGIGQQLTAALMAANGLHDELSAEAPSLAGKTQLLSRQLRDTLAEVRGLSHGLAPVPLWEHGLEHALQALVDSTSRSFGVRCIFECPGPVAECNEAMAGNLYRIAQEAVNNALKHAEAAEIRIGLEQHGDKIVMEIEDDGKGLPETLPEGGGIGLHVIRHRAGMMGGSIKYGTPPAGGTRIAVQIPLRQ